MKLLTESLKVFYDSKECLQELLKLGPKNWIMKWGKTSAFRRIQSALIKARSAIPPVCDGREFDSVLHGWRRLWVPLSAGDIPMFIFDWHESLSSHEN